VERKVKKVLVTNSVKIEELLAHLKTMTMPGAAMILSRRKFIRREKEMSMKIK
jgi:hypothetical protein